MHILNESQHSSNTYFQERVNRYLLDISTLQKFDVQEMYKVYDIWLQIAREQYETNLNGIDFGEISHVVFAGMEGSGTKVTEMLILKLINSLI